MKTFLKILGGIFGFLIFILFTVLLCLSPVLISVGILLTNRETPKTWLTTSGIYEDAVVMAQNIFTESLSKDAKEVDSSFVVKALEDAITPTYLKSNVEALLDGAYNWIEGKTENIEFEAKNLDLSKSLTKFIPKEQTELLTALKRLKPCTEAQAKKYEAMGGFSKLEDACLPPNLDITKMVDTSYQEQFTEGTNNAFSLFKPAPIEKDTTTTVRVVYKIFADIEYILPGVLLFLILLFFLVSPGKYSDGYLIGILSILTGGVFFAITKITLVLNLIFTFVGESIALGGVLVDAEPFKRLITVVVSDFFRVMGIVSIIMASVGVLIIIGTIALQSIAKKKAENTENTTPHDPVPTPQPEQKSSK